MSLDDYLKCLQELEKQLRAQNVQDYYSQQPADIRQRFVDYREGISESIGKLENAQLAKIVSKLNTLSVDLTRGAEDVQGAIDALNQGVQIIDTLENVALLAAQIARFA